MPTINIRYATDIAGLKANLKEGVDQIEASRQAVDKLASSLRGDNLVAAANKYAAAVREIGGAANLTASQQERVNSIMTRAVESMNAAGKGGTALAQHFKELAEATATVEAPTNHIIGFLADLGRQIVGTAAGFLTAQAALSGIQSVIRGVSSELETLTLHGAAVDDVATNFERLTTQAGLLGNQLLGALRAGSHNTITDFELMKTVNQDLSAGLRLTDQQFGTLAKGAFALAQATGTDVKTGLETMNDAMLTGRTRSLALLTGKIDLEAAEEKYAKSLGTTRDHLTDEGKLEAARAEILNSVSAATERLGEQTDGLDERVAQASVAWANFQDNLGKTIATSTVLETGLDGVKQILIETFGGSQQSLIQAIAGAIENAEIAIVEFGKTGVEMGGDIVEEFYAVKKIFGDIEQVLDGVRLAALYTDRAMITLHADSHPGETTADAWKRVDDAIGQTLVTMKDRGKDLQDADAAQQNVGKTTAELAARLEGLRGRMAAAQQASADLVGPLQDVSAAQSAGAASADQHGAATKRSAKEISEAEAAAKKFAAAMKEVNSAVGGIGGVLDALPVGPVTLANGKLAGSISQVVLELKKANVGESTIAEALHLTEAQVKAVVTAEESRVKILQLETAASEQLGESLNKLGKVDIETIAHLKEQLALGDKIRSAERAGLPGTGESTNIGQIGNIVGSSKAVVDGIEKVGQAFKETDADIADAIAQFGQIGPTLDQAQLGVQSFGESLRNDLGKTLDTLPSLLQQAFTGGGGIKGAIQALGAGLGADLGRNLATKFGDTITAKLTDVLGQKMGDAFGGLINKLLPGMGALVGAGLQEVFTLLEGKPEWQKIGDDIGRDLGVHISDSTAKAIAASEKTVQDALVKQLTEAAKAGSEAAARQLADITSASPARRQRALADTRPAAEELNLPQIISDAGGLNSTNLDEFTHKLRDVFSELEDGTITTALATKVLDDNWKAFVEAATDGDGRISAGLKEIIRLNAQFGTQSKEIAAFLKQQGQDAEAGFAGAADALLAPYAAMHEELQQNRDAVDALVAAGKTGTAEWTKAVQQLNDVANKTWQNFTTPDKIAGTTQQLRDLGTLAVATFSAAVAAGTPFYDALAAAAPQITQVYDAFQDLGIAIDDDAFSELALQAKILGTNKALVQGAADLGKMIVALDNMGLMNAQTFQSTERTAMAMYTRIQGEVVKVGGSTRDALLPMQDYLHKAAAEAALLGIPLDDNTQMLIDQSKELGIWKEAGKSAADKQIEMMDKLTQTIQHLIDTLSGIPNVDFTVTQHNRQVLDDTVGNAASQAASILAGQNGEAPEAQPGAGGATGGLVADLVRGFQPRSFAVGGPVGYSMPILPPANPSDTQLIWTNPNEWIFDRPRQAVILSQLQASASMAEFVRDTVREITAAPSAPQPSLANVTPRGGDVYLDSRKVGQVIWSPEALSGETRQLARLQVKQLGKEGA